MSRRIQTQAGFSLIEVVVTLAILAFVLTLSVPWFLKMQRQSRLNSVSMSFMGKVHQARNEALTGRILNNGSGAPTSAGDFDGWAAADKSKSAGLRITGASTYEFFVDADKIAGGEEVVAVVDLVAQHTDNQITFGGPVGQEIRFQNDGSAVNSQSIMVQDTDLGEAREITITKVGQVRIEAKKL